jgi:hypothetical protein
MPLNSNLWPQFEGLSTSGKFFLRLLGKNLNHIEAAKVTTAIEGLKEREKSVKEDED